MKLLSYIVCGDSFMVETPDVYNKGVRGMRSKSKFSQLFMLLIGTLYVNLSKVYAQCLVTSNLLMNVTKMNKCNICVYPSLHPQGINN